MTHPQGHFQRLFQPVRGLRFRLTVSYLVFCLLLLAGAGFVFRKALEDALTQRAQALLEEEWNALHGFIQIDAGVFAWRVDESNPDQHAALNRLRRIMYLADSNNHLIYASALYSRLGGETPTAIRDAISAKRAVFETRHLPEGRRYFIRKAAFRYEGQTYFLAVGTATDDIDAILQRFTSLYVILLPALIIVVMIVGWYAAGRALQPLSELAQATENISARNLHLRLPSHQTEDELEVLTRTFNRMLERLEQNFERIRNFTIDASHELRTPITAVRGQLEVALITAKNVDDYRNAVESSLEDVERLSQIVKSLLLLAQAESGNLALQKTEVDLIAILDEIVSHYRYFADDKKLGLFTSLPENCHLVADRALVELMLSNLVANAVKFSRQEGTVRVILTRNENEIRIEIQDSGPGIAQQHLPFIFDRLYRVREGEKDGEKGLGLGLTFVAWIAQAHGGRIDVKSEMGEGCCFTVVLPLDSTDSTDAPA